MIVLLVLIGGWRGDGVEEGVLGLQSRLLFHVVIRVLILKIYYYA